MPKSTPTAKEMFEETYDQIFGCCICLGPKLRMVSGKCQHRICDDCIYDGQARRDCMERCPVCGLRDSFPPTRPVLPPEVMSVQRILGVMECPNSSCSCQMWLWEVQEHLLCCPKSLDNKKKKPKMSVPKPCSSKSTSTPVTMRITRSAHRRAKSSGNETRCTRHSRHKRH